MCDYSATGVKQRSAAKGERLVSHKISSHTYGFAGINDPDTAVCLLPGTELEFKEPVRTRESTFVTVAKTLMGYPPCREKMATFVQVNRDNKNAYHDALRFTDNRIILLHDLAPGQEAQVITLPADPSTLKGQARKDAVAAQKRAEYI